MHIAFIGCGKVAGKHARLINNLDSKIKLSFASRNIEISRYYAKRYNGHINFDSYKSAIFNKKVDVIFITTPTSLHYEIAKLALENDKYVIVEKPAFMNTEQFNQILKVGGSTNRLMIAENYYYRPIRKHIYELIYNDLIGEIKSVNVICKKYQSIRGWRGSADMSGGGATFEGGIHWLSFMTNIGLKVNEVNVIFDKSNSKFNIDTGAKLNLKYENNTNGKLIYSWNGNLPVSFNKCSIIGSNGRVYFDSNGLVLISLLRNKKSVSLFLDDICGYRAMLKDFICSISANKNPEFTCEMAYRDIEILNDLYRSRHWILSSETKNQINNR